MSLQEDRARRITALEQRLRGVLPFWVGGTIGGGWLALYRSNDGFYVLRYVINAKITYFGISSSGQLKNMTTGFTTVDNIGLVVSCLDAAGLDRLSLMVKAHDD